MSNTFQDLSNLTAIPEKLLEKLSQSLLYVICQNVLEDTLSNITISEIDLGIGTLYIKHESSDIKFKFIPSDELKQQLTDTVINKLNLMEIALTEKLSNKLLEVYKDLC